MVSAHQYFRYCQKRRNHCVHSTSPEASYSLYANFAYIIMLFTLVLAVQANSKMNNMLKKTPHWQKSCCQCETRLSWWHWAPWNHFMVLSEILMNWPCFPPSSVTHDKLWAAFVAALGSFSAVFTWQFLQLKAMIWQILAGVKEFLGQFVSILRSMIEKGICSGRCFVTDDYDVAILPLLLCI